MFNTAKVDYLLCGSLEDEEKAKKQTKKKQRKWFIDNVWRWAGREGGACADGVFPVSVVVIMCL